MTAKTKQIGRPLKAAEPGKRVSLGLKVQPEIKSALDAAARMNGRTQSHEAEFRITQSLQREADLGGAEMAALSRIMIEAFRLGGSLGAQARGAKRTPAQWISDPVCFALGKEAVWRALEAHEPEDINLKRHDAKTRQRLKKLQERSARSALDLASGRKPKGGK